MISIIISIISLLPR